MPIPIDEETILNRQGRNSTLAVTLGFLIALATGVAESQDVVKIGFASPLTGPQANYGKDNQNGTQMAIDELNAQGLTIGGKAVKFQLQSEDDQADPKQGPLIAQKLADAKVAGVVGHFNSGVTIPASRVYNEAGIPELSVSTNVKYTHQGFKTAFRLMADDDKQGTALGEYAVKTLKLKRLAVIDDATAYGQGLADSFAAAVKASGGSGGQTRAHQRQGRRLQRPSHVDQSSQTRRDFLRRLRRASGTDGQANEDTGAEHSIDGR
jgi:branched-chain amino acid transport system substrate-binding protein